MPRSYSAPRLATALGLAVALFAGCKKTEPSSSPVPEMPTGPGPTGPGPVAAASEDPEVAAFIKAKGWETSTERRRSTESRIFKLAVGNPAKASDKLALTAEDYKMIAKSKAVQSLNLYAVDTTDDGLKTLAAMPQLVDIVIRGDKVTDDGIKALAAGCRGLEQVTLFGTKTVTDAGLKELATLPKIIDLDVRQCAITGAAFEAFADVKSLSHLKVWQNESFGDDGARAVSKVRSLRELWVEDTSVGDAGFQELLKLPALKELWLNDTKISQAVYEKAKADHPRIKMILFKYDNK